MTQIAKDSPLCQPSQRAIIIQIATKPPLPTLPSIAKEARNGANSDRISCRRAGIIQIATNSPLPTLPSIAKEGRNNANSDKVSIANLAKHRRREQE